MTHIWKLGELAAMATLNFSNTPANTSMAVHLTTTPCNEGWWFEELGWSLTESRGELPLVESLFLFSFF